MFSPRTGKSGVLILEITMYLHFAGLNWSKLTSDHMYSRLVVLPCFDLCRSKIFHVCTVFDVLVFLSSIHFDHSWV